MDMARIEDWYSVLTNNGSGRNLYLTFVPEHPWILVNGAIMLPVRVVEANEHALK